MKTSFFRLGVVVLLFSTSLLGLALGLKYLLIHRPQQAQVAAKIQAYNQLWERQQQTIKIHQLTSALVHTQATSSNYAQDFTNLLSQLETSVEASPQLNEKIHPTLEEINKRFLQFEKVFVFSPSEYLVDEPTQKINMTLVEETQQGLKQLVAASENQLPQELLESVELFSQISNTDDLETIILSYDQVKSTAASYVIAPLKSTEMVATYAELEAELKSTGQELSRLQNSLL